MTARCDISDRRTRICIKFIVNSPYRSIFDFLLRQLGHLQAGEKIIVRSASFRLAGSFNHCVGHHCLFVHFTLSVRAVHTSHILCRIVTGLPWPHYHWYVIGTSDFRIQATRLLGWALAVSGARSIHIITGFNSYICSSEG